MRVRVPRRQYLAAYHRPTAPGDAVQTTRRLERNALNHSIAAGTGGPNFARRFLLVWLAGIAGALGLLLTPLPLQLTSNASAVAHLPAWQLRLLLLVNPLVLVTLAAAAGALAAHRVGFKSLLAGAPAATLAAALSISLGLGASIVIRVADAALAPMLGAQWQAFAAEANATPALPSLVAGALYGGLAEEVIMRWGLMTVVAAGLAWALRRLRSGGGSGLPASAAWTAIVVTALAFGAGHLPALAASVDLTAPVVLRTLALNTVGGLIYGWLYWRRSLEAAMLAHASTHAGFAVMRGIGL